MKLSWQALHLRLTPRKIWAVFWAACRSEEHTSELQSRQFLVCRLLLEKTKDMALIATLGFFKLSSPHPDAGLPPRPSRTPGPLASVSSPPLPVRPVASLLSRHLHPLDG